MLLVTLMRSVDVNWTSPRGPVQSELTVAYTVLASQPLPLNINHEFYKKGLNN